MMLNILITLHLFGTIVWVGGMFFAHMALRPAVNEKLEPPLRLQLMQRVLGNFFPWVWLAILLIIGSGYGIFLGLWGAQADGYVHLMQTIGWIMVGIFCYIYFVPFRRLGQALSAGEIPSAAAAMALLRRLIGINLILGLVTSLVGASRLF